MAKKLHSYAKKSSLLDIRLKLGSELIRFNLYDELVIDTRKLNDELMNQPTHFGYLSMIMIKLKKVRDSEEAKLQKLKDSIFIDFKGDIDPQTGRVYSNDLAEAYITQDEEYQEQLTLFRKVENNFLVVKACVDAFSQRKDIIQTLSANVRQERSIT